ncbi:DUF6713 family protein [Variovorax sp. PCZ-1]|uniref:DUF6713 family protein n=1 Tax=Variovorax sp. PCZ-1 TaxID=2835533 RepID=UPI001BCD6DAD|nr:DUF6713 family protein [Variovorax sp. PCZ-1]MBS7806085.1 hypothetical protein [Variovorax sp. PCZ-1]
MKASTALTQLMLALLFAHELDAMTQSEWRLLYVLRSLNDEQGRWWFVAIHVPLFWALIALTHHPQAGVQRVSRLAFAAFCIVHALLHWRLANDPLSTFNSPLSWSLILGAAVLGVAYLAFTLRNDPKM